MLLINVSPATVTVQLDDEASLLPRKLQGALEQALEQRNNIVSQDSDSESDDGKRLMHLVSLKMTPRRVARCTTSRKSDCYIIKP